MMTITQKTHAQNTILGRIKSKNNILYVYNDYTENTDPDYYDHMDHGDYSAHIGTDGEF